MYLFFNCYIISLLLHFKLMKLLLNFDSDDDSLVWFITTFRVLHRSAPPYIGPMVPVRMQSSRQTVASFYRHRSSSGAIGQAINRRYPCFLGRWPKDLEHPARDVTSLQSKYTFCRHLKRCFSRSLFWTLSSGTDCILTFSLGLSVPSLRRFCRLSSTI